MATRYRYEELRPDQLELLLKEVPVAHWPLGLLEHHGWHLPIGFDGLTTRMPKPFAACWSRPPNNCLPMASACWC